ncbi:hypothetical protein MPER_12898 [Moniliophthora perniciosa FA553]|nr:hypothetical protein MPER_12898 [Moniliophthora perniciosa FA553]
MSARLTAKNLEESERVFQLAQKTHQDAQKDVRKATRALENCEKKITELDSNPRLTRDKDRKRRDLDAMLVVQRTILEQAKLREKTMFGNLARAENDLEKAKALLGAVECVGGGGDSHTNDANNGFGSSDLSDIDEEPDATRVETSKTTEKPLTRNKRKEVPGGHTTEHSSSKKAKAFVGPSSRANKNNTKRRPVLTGDQSVNTPAKEASESSETSNAVNANVDGSADTSSMVNATQSPNVDGPGGHPTATALADGGTGVSRDHGEPANTPRMPDIDKSAGHRTPNPASSPSTSFSPSNGGMPATAPPGDNPLDLQAHLTASWPPLTTSQPSSPKSSCTADGSAVRDIDAATEDSAPPGKVLYDHDMLLEWMRENPQGFWNQPDVTSGYGEAPDDRSVTDPPTLHLPSTTNKGKSKDLAISTPSGTDSLAPSAQTHKGVLHVDASDSDVTRSTASNRDVVTVRAALQGPSAGQLFDGDSDIIMASSGDQETRNGSANDVSPSTVEINFRDFVVKQDVDNEDDMVLVQDLSPTSLIREIMKNTMTSATTKVSHMQVKKTVANGQKASKKTTGRKRGERPGQRVPATEVESQDDDTTPTSKTFDSNAPDTPDDEDDKDYEDEEDEGDDSDEEKTLYNQKSDEGTMRVWLNWRTKRLIALWQIQETRANSAFHMAFEGGFAKGLKTALGLGFFV